MKNGQTGSNQNWNISDTSRRETACQIWVQLACTVCFYHFTRNTCIFCCLRTSLSSFIVLSVSAMPSSLCYGPRKRSKKVT